MQPRFISISVRAESAIGISDRETDMLLNKPIEEWRETIESFDMPYYFITFGGIIIDTLEFAFKDDAIALYIMEFLLNIFPFPPEDEAFIRNYYLPEVKIKSISFSVLTPNDFHFIRFKRRRRI